MTANDESRRAGFIVVSSWLTYAASVRGASTASRDRPSAAGNNDLPIAARGLAKSYGHVAAVAGIDLTVNRGDIYGFLGPNGAGKTTAMRILLGLGADAGEVRLFGRDPRHEMPRALDGVGWLRRDAALLPLPERPEEPGALRGLRRRQRLEAGDRCPRSGRARDRAADKVGGYSQGMRQRLGLAASLLRSRVC